MLAKNPLLMGDPDAEQAEEQFLILEKIWVGEVMKDWLKRESGGLLL